MRAPAPPHLLLGAYCAGLCLVLAWRPPLLLLAAAAAVGVGTLAVGSRLVAVGTGAPGLRHRTVATAGGLCLLFICAGAVLGDARLESVARSALAAYTGERVSLTAVLIDLPDIKDGQVTLAVRVTSADGHVLREPAHLRLWLDDGQTFVHDPTGPLTEGVLLRLPSVRVKPLPEPTPGEFDYGRYLRRRGEQVLLDADFADLSITGRRGGLQGVVDKLRLASRAHLAAGVHSPVADVLQGMVLGDDEGVDEALIEDFRRSGLLHIMAVSGENVVLLCGMWSFAFALLGMHRLLRTALLLPVVATYVLLTGASPSIVRAGVAGIVGLLAVLASRPSDGWLLWLAPAAWLLTVNPNNLFDVSFQLSFGAVVGLLLIARPLTRLVSFLPGPLPEQVGVTTAASISTAPISMLSFGSASLVSVPANVAGGFVLGPIMFFGMLSLLLGFVSGWLSGPLNVVAGLFIGFLISVAHWFGNLPGAVYEWRGVSLPLVLTLALLAELGVIAVLAARAGGGGAGAGSGGSGEGGPGSSGAGGGLVAYVRDRRRRLPLAAATALVVAAALILTPAPAGPPDRPTLTFLDVGEGAATLLQVTGGPTVLFDAGPEPLARALGEHGVGKVDLLVLSHGHDDHVGGLEDVIGSVPVTVALLPEPDDAATSSASAAALDDIETRLRAEGTDVRRCTSELRLAGREWALDVLPSDPTGGVDQNQKENDDALVAVVELGGQRVLLPGDAEGQVLENLDLPPCLVVGTPHHGSAEGFDAALLAELAPSLAVIPVGKNSFGHPDSETIEVLATAGVPYLRTDERGDIALTLDDGELRVTAERGG